MSNISRTNKDRSLTPWGAQQQLGLLVKDPVGEIAQVVNVNNFGDCNVYYANSDKYHTWPCRTLRIHPVPLTPETSYVGQWVRGFKGEFAGSIGEIVSPEMCEGGYIENVTQESLLEEGLVVVAIDNWQNTDREVLIVKLQELEALPAHCQTVNKELV